MSAICTSILEDCYKLLSKTNSNVVWEILRQSGTFHEWKHYPESDVYDKETHSQYYYHAHAKDSSNRWAEHGHFHIFIRSKGIPQQCKPKPLLPIQDGILTDDICHLCAISMDAMGRPTHLFTTNRWVTGETWYAASDVIKLLNKFAITHAWPSWPTNIWLTQLVKIYKNEIKNLILQRDITVNAWQQKHPESNVYEDRKLEVTSFLDIR